jgi:hypothetical protein
MPDPESPPEPVIDPPEGDLDFAPADPPEERTDVPADALKETP